MTRWQATWFSALTLLLALELWTVASPAAGDTLSEQVIPLLESPAAWGATLLAWLAFASWLTWHWWFQYRNRRR